MLVLEVKFDRVQHSVYGGVERLMYGTSCPLPDVVEADKQGWLARG